MKTILEYINEYFTNKYNMINEAFQSKVLKEISKQCNDEIAKNIQINKEKKWNFKQTTNTFKKLLGSEYIEWDKLTDDMFKEYDKTEENVKFVSKLLSSTKKGAPTVIILLNNDENNTKKYIGVLIHVFDSNASNYVSFMTEYGWSKEIKRKDVDDLLTNKFLVVDVTNALNTDKHSQRNSNKSGAINIFNDADAREYYYKQVASANRERYRKYLDKVKADKEANDEIPKMVREYTNKVFDVAEKLSSNPIKYSKFEYEIGWLLDLLNDTRRYVNDTRYKGHYTGKDGLITLFKRYMTNKLSLAQGNSYDHEKRSYEDAKRDINLIFKTIDERIKKFDDSE